LPALSPSDGGRALLEPVRHHWPLVAILLANLLAAIVCFMAGKWVGDTNRYDGCAIFDTGTQRFWACSIDEQPAPPSPPAGDV
jgi:hypothetical protein